MYQPDQFANENVPVSNVVEMPKPRRKNGKGCVVQRGNRFQISYYDAEGRRRRKSYKTLEKAEGELAYKIKLREKGKPDEAETRITVDALSELYITKCRGTAPKSIDWIELVWRVHLEPFFGGSRRTARWPARCIARPRGTGFRATPESPRTSKYSYKPAIVASRRLIVRAARPTSRSAMRTTLAPRRGWR